MNQPEKRFIELLEINTSLNEVQELVQKANFLRNKLETYQKDGIKFAKLAIDRKEKFNESSEKYKKMSDKIAEICKKHNVNSFEELVNKAKEMGVINSVKEVKDIKHTDEKLN